MSEHRIPLAEAERKANGQGRPSRIRLVPFDAITVETTGNYTVKGLIPDAGLSVVWGPPKCGKSFFTSDIALHVALGWPWRDRRVKQGAVVYLAAEGAHGFKARIEAFRQERLPEDIGPVPFYLVPVTIDLIGEHLELIGAIRKTLTGADGEPVDPVLCVVDTLNRTLKGSENSDEDMSDYIKAADAIREAFDCAVVIVHHCGVEGSRPRGHTSLSGAVDAQIAVKKANGIVTATVELCKDGAEGEAFGGILKVVELGEDEDGDPITSCILEPAEPETGAANKRLTPKMQRGLEVLQNLLIDAGKPSPGGPNYPDNGLVVAIDLWRKHLFLANVLNKEAANPRQGFKRLFDGLDQRGAIRSWDNVMWPTFHDL